MEIKFTSHFLLPKKKMMLFIMRSFLFLFSTTVFSLSSNKFFGEKAKIRMDEDKIVAPDEIFDLFRHQTEFTSIYPKDLFKTTPKVVLEEGTISGRNFNFDSTENNKIVVTKVKQQQEITGTVTDTNGAPIPGVSVVVKGTLNGTVTNFDGQYKITNVPVDSILEFSFLGMETQEVSVGKKSRIDILMREDVIDMDEVIVVGYGSVKKSNLTSSVSKITNAAIENRPVANIGEALQGQLAGVRATPSSGRPGDELTIRIRGKNTINGDSSPLYVIDGVPRNGMSDLNPNDIASIQILKDAASTAIYGARGGNGVVLIETKQGKGKPVITFESNIGFSTAERTMDIMNGPEFVAYNMYRRNVDHLRLGGSMSDPMSSRRTQEQIPDFWNTTTEFTDWQNTVLQTAPFQNYNLSASAKGDIGSIYFSAGYLDQVGILKFSGFNRKNIRLNTTLNISKNLRAGVNFAASSAFTYGSNGNSKDAAFQQAINASPLLQVDENTPGTDFIPSTLIGSSPANPLSELEFKREDSYDSRLFASIFAEWDILDGLTLRSQYSDNFDNNTYEYFFPQSVSRQPSRGIARNDNYRQWSIQNTLNYTKQFGDHSFEALIGQAAEKQTGFGIDAESRDYSYESIYTLNVTNIPYNASSDRNTYTNSSLFGRVSYNFKEKYLLTASVRRDGSARFGQNNKYGVFPAFSAGWKLNEEAFMKDISWINLLKPRFSWGKSGNDRIGDYRYEALLGTTAANFGGAVVAGVYPSNIPNPDLQWEATKNMNIGFDFNGFNNRVQINLDYYINKTEDLLFNVNVPGTTGFGSQLANLGAVENRGWELDITTHNLTGDFKWNTQANFSRNTNEILDMGEIDSFVTSVSFGGYYLTEVGGPVGQFYGYKSDGILTSEDFDSSGKALVPVLPGQEEGNVKYIDQNGDGIISATGDSVGYGKNLPDLIYGLTNTFSYKNFTLSVLVQGQTGGNTMWLGARGFDGTFGGVNVLSHWLRGYKIDFEAKYGPGENPIPTEYIERNGIDMSWDGWSSKPDGNYINEDDRRVHSSDYFRIKNITLGYDMPKSILDKSPFTGLRIYGSLDNVKLWTDYPSFNPDSNTRGDNNISAGTDYITYPLSRRAVFGIVASF